MVVGGGEENTYTRLLKNGFLTNCLLFKNTQVCCCTNWLQLMLLMYGNPVVTTKCFTVWKPKVVNLTTI